MSGLDDSTIEAGCGSTLQEHSFQGCRLTSLGDRTWRSVVHSAGPNRIRNELYATTTPTMHTVLESRRITVL